MQSYPSRFFSLVAALAVLGATVGCAAPDPWEKGPRQPGDPLRVVATTGMIADVAREIGGDHVDVVQMMGAGIDPHLYRATESDVTLLVRADIILYNGVHLEARMAEVFERIATSRRTVAVGDGIAPDRLLIDPVYGTPDPHIWMDVSLWMLAAGHIRDTFIEADPANAVDYRARAARYLAEMAALDAYVRAELDRVPAEQRVLVTAHDAFQYYGRAYHIEVFAPQGITTQSEAGVEDIRATIDLLTQRRIPAIFVETSVAPDVIEAIIAGAEARGHRVVVGGSLYSDAMGDAGTPEGTYLGMIRHNTDTIVTALLGQFAP